MTNLLTTGMGIMGEHTVEAWVTELSRYWQAWVQDCKTCSALQAGDLDSLTLFSYHLLLPEPELHEIRHAVSYMLVEVLRIKPGNVSEGSIDAFARQLHGWRATKPRGDTRKRRWS